MEQLSTDLQQKIIALIDDAYKAYSKESIDESVRILNEAWDLIPEDKSTWDEGYRVAHEFIETYFHFGNFIEAEKWVEVYLKSAKQFYNYGRAEFMAGRIAYEIGKFYDAKAFFILSDEKSEGRVWKSNGQLKYLKFYKTK
jgi:hypothetical protein